MHGIIHLELKKFVEARHGAAAWPELLQQAGLFGPVTYDATGQYPDEELVALLAATARRLDVTVDSILEDFGHFIVPDLLTMYPRLIRPEWRTLDFLLNTEKTMHYVVRLNNPVARPALLRCSQPKPDEVLLTYSSPRRFCAFARGIIRGVASHYRERVSIMEITCMLRGAAACTLAVRLQGPAP